MKLTGSTTLAVGDVINLQIPVTGSVFTIKRMMNI